MAPSSLLHLIVADIVWDKIIRHTLDLGARGTPAIGRAVGQMQSVRWEQVSG